MNNIVITGGIHGDEKAGPFAAIILQRVFPEIPNYSLLNPIGFIKDKRRCGRKDLNRQFNKNDNLTNDILRKILSHQPKVVINLHEDSTIDYCYAYCSEELRDLVEESVNKMKKILPGIAKVVHGDRPKNSVITHERCVDYGTLETILEKNGIKYVCLETPQQEHIVKRIKALSHGAAHIIKNLK